MRPAPVWIVTTEVNLLGDDDDRINYLEVGLTAYHDDNGIRYHKTPGLDEDSTLGEWYRRFAESNHVKIRSAFELLDLKLVEQPADGLRFLLSNQFTPQRSVRAEDLDVVAADLAANARLPVFGSPPQDWQTLAEWVSSGAVQGTSVLTAGTPESPIGVLMVGGATALYLHIGKPALHEIGVGIGLLIREYFRKKAGVAAQESEREDGIA